MNKLVLKPGEAVKIREPKTCWQQRGGTIVEVWPNYDHPENSIVGVAFPRGVFYFYKEISAFKASELLPWNYPGQ